MENDDNSEARMAAWRQRLGLEGSNLVGLEASLEAGVEPSLEGVRDEAQERIRRAREQMRRIVIESFGGDAALLAAIDELVLTSQEAVKVLEAAEREPQPDEYSSLEAIVSFDGTRPSFLVRDGRIDLNSSFSTSAWKTTLAPRLAQLEAFASCVGRVEMGENGIGTAFLVAPTLALTNRHVAQLIAPFAPGGIELRADIFLDFGREHTGRVSFDRRAVRKVLFAGVDLIAAPVDHNKLDLALLEVAPSTLAAPLGNRKLELDRGRTDIVRGGIVAATGYPADWHQYVPAEFVAKHEAVIAKLLEGEGGSKRFAPGESKGLLPTGQDGIGPRTAAHDATTINGNSGSPLVVLDETASLRAAGLHYGGQWRGERTNWAHVLASCAGAPVTGGQDLRSAFARYDVLL